MTLNKKEYDRQRYIAQREKFQQLHKQHYDNNRDYYHEKSKRFATVNPEKNRTYKKKSKAQRIREAKAHILNIKLKSPCADCGYSNPICLQFHHVDPSTKTATIARLLALGMTIEKIDEEIAKCIILCANCHLLRHHSSSP